LPEIHRLSITYKNQYRFIGVYIQEAHASDEWPIQEAPQSFRQHQSTQERLEACRIFVRDYAPFLRDVEFFVDKIDNEFESAYASWPFRFWVLNSTQILFKAMPKQAAYDLRELEQFLKEPSGIVGV